MYPSFFHLRSPIFWEEAISANEGNFSSYINEIRKVNKLIHYISVMEVLAYYNQPKSIRDLDKYKKKLSRHLRNRDRLKLRSWRRVEFLLRDKEPPVFDQSKNIGALNLIFSTEEVAKSNLLIFAKYYPEFNEIESFLSSYLTIADKHALNLPLNSAFAGMGEELAKQIEFFINTVKSYVQLQMKMLEIKELNEKISP